MKRAIISVFEEMENQLSGISAVATFGYMAQCVNAEEIALLNVSVNIEREEKYLEEVARVAKPEDNYFIIIPHYEEDLSAVKAGIHTQYPEFEIETGTKEVEVSTGPEDENPDKVKVKYLKVTMPSVDEERQSTLNETVEKIYQKCQDQMKTTYISFQKKLDSLTTNEGDDVKKEVEESFSTVKQKWNEHCEKVYSEKKEEIKAGYQKWQVEQKEAKKEG